MGLSSKAFCIFSILIFSVGFTAESLEEKVGQKKIEVLKIKKKEFLNEIKESEKKCLLKIFSAPCLKKLQIKHDNGIREFELKKQNIKTRIRRHEAEKRKLRRDKKYRDFKLRENRLKNLE
tara:strand:- start:9583 stop:9945 length:363 start_codon:yes stop_codon:yes gene_type:complete